MYGIMVSGTLRIYGWTCGIEQIWLLTCLWAQHTWLFGTFYAFGMRTVLHLVYYANKCCYVFQGPSEICQLGSRWEGTREGRVVWWKDALHVLCWSALHWMPKSHDTACTIAHVNKAREKCWLWPWLRSMNAWIGEYTGDWKSEQCRYHVCAVQGHYCTVITSSDGVQLPKLFSLK